jgi:hypothetical protein
MTGTASDASISTHKICFSLISLPSGKGTTTNYEKGFYVGSAFPALPVKGRSRNGPFQISCLAKEPRTQSWNLLLDLLGQEAPRITISRYFLVFILWGLESDVPIVEIQVELLQVDQLRDWRMRTRKEETRKGLDQIRTGTQFDGSTSRLA